MNVRSGAGAMITWPAPVVALPDHDTRDLALMSRTIRWLLPIGVLLVLAGAILLAVGFVGVQSVPVLHDTAATHASRTGRTERDAADVSPSNGPGLAATAVLIASRDPKLANAPGIMPAIAVSPRTMVGTAPRCSRATARLSLNAARIAATAGLPQAEVETGRSAPDLRTDLTAMAESLRALGLRPGHTGLADCRIGRV